MTNMAWDDELNEDSCISYGEWNNMVTWMKDLASYLDDSFCSLGDMGISDCNSIVTNGDLCSRIASTCTNIIKDIINGSYLTSLGVCTLGDMDISDCNSIVTDGDLCSRIASTCINTIKDIIDLEYLETLGVWGYTDSTCSICLSSYCTDEAPISAAVIESVVTDTDLYLKTNGTGVVKFGTYTEDSGASIIGYITIRDEDGNLRYLACVEPGGA
jgi:hypothetical protein